MTTALLRVRILRQDGPERVETRRWEELRVESRSGMTVADVLAAIERAPLTWKGSPAQPVAWESWCLDETCGACTMRIQGRARLACATRVDAVVSRRGALVLEPLREFPLVRDLVVDRERMSDGVRRLETWIGAVGQPAASELVISPELSAARRALAACTSCGACLDACPQVSQRSEFVGAALIARAELALLHPLGALERTRRAERLMAPGGVAECGKAQLCAEVCPRGVPLVDALQQASGATTRRFLLGWLLG